jgi:hypothetical protein
LYTTKPTLYKTSRIPRGFKVDNISDYISNLSPNDELVQEFNKDFELPEGIDSWESVRSMLDKVLPKPIPENTPTTKSPSMVYLPTESDGFHTVDVKESAQSYAPKSIPRSVYRHVHNISSKCKPKLQSPEKVQEDLYKQGDEAMFEMESHVHDKLHKDTYTKEDISTLCEAWFTTFADIFKHPETLPPLRLINHKITLIDPSKFYNYYYPRCAEALKAELIEKINRYTKAGWWVEANVDQAAPMLCIPKKTGKLRTAIDCHKCNANTVCDVTPLPDQDQIRINLARGKYCSKLDISDAFEQMRMDPEDESKTAFATVMETFTSQIMQIGDCNSPATWQRMMNLMFRDYIGRFVHVYLDDIFVFSETIADHSKYIALIAAKL